MRGEEKLCVTCGRRFAWRKAWERDWEQVKACSKACSKGYRKGCSKVFSLEVCSRFHQHKFSGSPQLQRQFRVWFRSLCKPLRCIQ